MSDDFSSGDIAAAVSASSTPSASDASPASAPTTPESTSAPTIAAPESAASTVQETNPVPSGEPPKERWPDILDNARLKEREAIQKEWEPYAWAKSVPREELHRMSGIAQRMSSDPLGFLADFVKELEAHPTHSQALRSQAGRILSNGRQVDLSPDLVVDDGQGRQIATFSAQRVTAIVNKAVEDALAKRVAPLESDLQKRTTAERVAEHRASVEKAADALWTKAQTWPGFTDSLKDIDAAMAQGKTLHDAYIEVVVPNLSKTERTKVLKDLSSKPAASSVSPATSTSSVPKPDAEKSWEELFREKATAAGIGR